MQSALCSILLPTEILTSDTVKELTAGDADSYNYPVLIFFKSAEVLKCYDRTVYLVLSLQKEVRYFNSS